MAETARPSYVTGLCDSGGHEGKPTLSPGGLKLKQCMGDYTFGIGNQKKVVCDCWCHELLRAFRPDVRIVAQPILPGPELQALRRREEGTGVDYFRRVITDELLEVQLRMFIYKMIFKEKIPTELLKPAPRHRDSGRRLVGALEVNVEAVCRIFLEGHLPYPKLELDSIAQMIDAMDMPSVGAIRNVLSSWADDGLCEFETQRPAHFIRFTDRVPSGGLYFLREKQ